MTQTSDDRSARTVVPITVRLPADMVEALRNYAFVTDTSANDVIKRALAIHLQENGRTEFVRAAFERVIGQHAVALDKLADL